jgi:hypothetical protein
MDGLRHNSRHKNLSLPRGGFGQGGGGYPNVSSRGCLDFRTQIFDFFSFFNFSARHFSGSEQKANTRMDEGRKRVLGIMAAILASLHMQTADDLFGGPQGSPRTDKLLTRAFSGRSRSWGRLTADLRRVNQRLWP